MIVYAESNFLLELAYLQEEHDSCEQLLSLAGSGRLPLRVPAFAITEARMSLARQTRQREEFQQRLAQQIRELSRSEPYSNVPEKSRELISALIDSAEEERRRLNETVRRVLQIGTVLPTTAEALSHASAAEDRLGLSPQDALVYASVILDVQNDPETAKCFLNRNSKDFANPDIYAELGAANCKLLTSFQDGLAFVRNAIEA